MTVNLFKLPLIVRFNRKPFMNTLFSFPMIVRFTITLLSALIVKKELLQSKVTEASVIEALMFPDSAEFGYTTLSVPNRLFH